MIAILFRILDIDFIVLEKETDILKGATSHNFDAIFDINTALRECSNIKFDNSDLFKRLFNHLIIGTHNSYHILTKKCIINIDTVNAIFKKYNHSIKTVGQPHKIPINKTLVNAVFRCEDKLLNYERAYSFFKEFLKDKIICGYDQTKFIHKDKISYNNYNADYIVDCTNGNFDKIDKSQLLLIYNTSDVFAKNIINIGLIGKLNVTPYRTNKLIVTDLEYGIIDHNLHNETAIKAKIELINNKITKYFPDFNKNSTFEYYKLYNYCNTECKITNKIIKIRVAHITSIFEIYDKLFIILDELKNINQDYLNHNPITISKMLNFYGRELHEQEIQHHSKNTRKYNHILRFVYELMNCQEFTEKYIMPTLKIAVLFFGYTRDLHKNYEKHKILLKWKPDVFIHTYDSSGKKAKNKNVKWIDDNELENRIDLKFLMEKYNPIKIKIEKNILDELSIKDGKLIPILIYQAKDDATKYINSQLYTRYEVVKLKEEYEKLKKIKYDIVLLTRFDFGFDKLNMFEIIRMDMSRIYFPGYNSRHSHPGKGGGCLRCDANDIHFGESHKNDFCDVWTLSSSDNISIVGKLFSHAKDILYASRDKTYEYVIKNNIKHAINNTILYIYSDFEHEDVVCYYPERLLREYLRDYICLTYNNICGMITKIE